MSHVTTLILITDLWPLQGCSTDDMEKFIHERCPSLRGITHINDLRSREGVFAVGGDKAAQVEILVGAFNYLDHRKVLEELRALPWVEDAVVQIVVNGEHDSGVQLLTLVGKPKNEPFDFEK